MKINQNGWSIFFLPGEEKEISIQYNTCSSLLKFAKALFLLFH